MTELENGIVIRNVFERALRGWQVLLGFGLLGALCGLIFSRIHPPLYESEAVMGINIQYGVTEPLELVVEDRALHRAAQLVLSDATFVEVLERLSPQIRDQKGWSAPDEFRRAVRLDRGLTDWRLVASDQDPEVAQQVAALWLDVALEALEEAQEHSWRALGLMGEETFHLACSPIPIVPEPGVPSGWRCSLESISLDAEALSGALRTEIAQSRGILPILAIERLREPVLPDKPALRNSSSLILSGAFIGLVVGLWIVGSDGAGIFRLWRRREKDLG